MQIVHANGKMKEENHIITLISFAYIHFYIYIAGKNRKITFTNLSNTRQKKSKYHAYKWKVLEWKEAYR